MASQSSHTTTRYASAVYDEDKCYFSEQSLARIPFKWEAAPGTPNKKYGVRLTKNSFFHIQGYGEEDGMGEQVSTHGDDVGGDVVLDADVAADNDSSMVLNANVHSGIAASAVLAADMAIGMDKVLCKSSKMLYHPPLPPPPGLLALPTPFRVKDIHRHSRGMARSFRFMSFRLGHNASIVPLMAEKSKHSSNHHLGLQARSQSCLDRRDLTSAGSGGMVAKASSKKLRDLMQQSHNFSQLLSAANELSDTDCTAQMKKKSKTNKKNKKKIDQKRNKEWVRHRYANPIPSDEDANDDVVEAELAQSLRLNSNDTANYLKLDSADDSKPFEKISSPDHEFQSKFRFFPVYTCTACWH